MNIQQLASELAKKEGNKSQSRIGDIRELLSLLSDMSYDEAQVIQVIIKNGIARRKRKKKSASL